jgi:hypothetical protein
MFGTNDSLTGVSILTAHPCSSRRKAINFRFTVSGSTVVNFRFRTIWRGDQFQLIAEISPKYRGSFNTLAFSEIKPPEERKLLR